MRWCSAACKGTATHSCISDVSSVEEVQKVENRQPWHDVPVDSAEKLAFVYAGRIYLGAIERLGGNFTSTGASLDFLIDGIQGARLRRHPRELWGG